MTGRVDSNFSGEQLVRQLKAQWAETRLLGWIGRKGDADQRIGRAEELAERMKGP